MKEKSIKNLIKEGEHQTLDFKFRIDDQKKIARTLCAFANTYGGTLLIGVKDNGKIAGINPEEEFHMIEGAAKLFCKPEIKFESKVWQEDMRLVLEITIPQNPNKEHKAADEEGKIRSYIRRKDHTLIANKILLKIWTFEKKGIPKPQNLGDDELLFLKIFTEQKITLSKIYRLSVLEKNKVDHLLALFVYWNLISMEINEEGYFYSLSV